MRIENLNFTDIFSYQSCNLAKTCKSSKLHMKKASTMNAAGEPVVTGGNGQPAQRHATQGALDAQ